MAATLQDVLIYLKDDADLIALKHISTMISLRWKMLAAERASEIQVGNTVQWVGKDGIKVHGTVTSQKGKWILVRRSDGMIWKVGPAILTRI